MDGHPDVHAKTIRESCARHNALIVNSYFLEAQALGGKLSQSEKRIAVSEQVRARIEHYRSVVPAASGSAPSSHDRMPYRVLLAQIAARLRATYEHGSGQYERVEQLIDDLEIIARSLAENRGRAAGLFYVRRMLRRVRTFGFHLATLDVRQNAEVHREVIAKALAADDWLQRTPLARAERLREALAKDESPPGVLEAAGKRALWVFEAMEYCSHRYGQAAIGSYVVSMAKDVRRHPVRAAAGALGGPTSTRRPARWASTSRRCSSRSRRSRPRARSCRACSTTRSIAPTWRRAATARS